MNTPKDYQTFKPKTMENIETQYPVVLWKPKTKEERDTFEDDILRGKTSGTLSGEYPPIRAALQHFCKEVFEHPEGTHIPLQLLLERVPETFRIMEAAAPGIQQEELREWQTNFINFIFFLNRKEQETKEPAFIEICTAESYNPDRISPLAAS